METLSIIYLSTCVVVITCVLGRIFRKPNKESERIDVTKAQVGQKKEKEDLKHTLDTVNSWIKNCDQKAGILFTVIGVALTVILTSDFLKSLKDYVFSPFIEYLSDNDGNVSFSWSRFTVFILLAFAVFILIRTCYCLFKAITANVDYKKMAEDNPGLVNKSYIYYGSISEMSFEEFNREDEDYCEDLKSQIYVNSRIAITKYQNYNKGLQWFKILLTVSIMLFIAVLLMN